LARFNSGGATGGAPTPPLVPWILLDTHVALGIESSYTFTPTTPIDIDDFSELVILIAGVPTLALAMELAINSVVTNYFDDGSSIKAGVETLVNNDSQTQWQIATTNAISIVNAEFFIEVHIILPNTVQNRERIDCWSMVLSGATILESLGHTLTTPDIVELVDLKFTTSTSTWKAGTTFKTYGVKNNP